MNGASKNLEQYELKGQIIHQHVRNLAQTLATFMDSMIDYAAKIMITLARQQYPQ